MPDFYFRGTLVQYWQVVYAEWARYSYGDIHARSPLAISHPFKDRPPMEFEEVVLEFLDDYFRRPPEPEPDPIPGIIYPTLPTFVFPLKVSHVPVTVRAESAPNGNLVGLTVIIEKEAYKEFGQSALSRWNEVQNNWQQKGLLISPAAYIAKLAQMGMKPEQLPKPQSGADLDVYFDLFHQKKKDGKKYTLKQIAEETGYEYPYVRQLHSKYLKKMGLTRSKKRTNKRTNKN
jgi:hypothetical protein